MSELRCSVVVPTHNRPHNIPGLLSSLAEQADTGIPFEVILVDDGSSPPLSVEAETPFPLSIERLDRNRGRAGARNAGAGRAQTPLIVFMDDDIRPVAGFIRAYVERIDPGGSEVGVGRVLFHPDLPRDRLLEYQESRNIAKLGPDDPVPFRYFLTYNCAIPAELFRSTGGFDERLCVWGGEDTELGYRLAQAGVSFVRVDGAEAFNTHRRNLDEVWEVSKTFAQKSMPLIFEKHPDVAQTLHADVLGPPRFANGFSFRRFAVRLATLPSFAHPVRWLVSSAPGFPWPMSVYDYLIASAWRSGLDEAEKE